MARRKKSDASATAKPVNIVGVRKSTRQIARRHSVEGKKANGEISRAPSSPEVQKPSAEENPKPPEVVVKRKRGRPRLTAPKEPKDLVQPECLLSESTVDIKKHPSHNNSQEIPENVVVAETIQPATSQQVVSEKFGTESDPIDTRIEPEDDSMPETLGSESVEVIVPNSHEIPTADETSDGTWPTEDVIEETIICEEMEVETDDANVVLEQVLLMNEPSYEGNNVVYVIQNEDGTESMVMPNTDGATADENYQENSEYQIIEQGVECLSVDDSETSKDCEHIVTSDRSEVYGDSGESKSSAGSKNPELSPAVLEESEKMVTDDETATDKLSPVPADVVPEENHSSTCSLSQEVPEVVQKIDRRKRPRTPKEKIKISQSNSDFERDPSTIRLQEIVGDSIDVPEDSSNSCVDSTFSNPSLSSSELLMTLQNDETTTSTLENADTPEQMDSESAPFEPKEDSEDSVRTLTPILESAKINKSPENPQDVEELSRESEPDMKIDNEDVKISSSSDNSNDTASLSSVKTQESSDKSSGQSDNDKKGHFRNRSGSTDTTGSESGSNSSAIRRSSRIRSQGLAKQRSRGRGLVTKPIADVTKAFQHEREKLQPISTPPVGQPAGNTPDSQSETQSDKENSNKPAATESNALTIISTSGGYDSDSTKPVKVKSRWRRSSELEMGGSNVAKVGFGYSGVLTTSTPPTSNSESSILPTIPENSLSNSNSLSSETESLRDSLSAGQTSSSPVPKAVQPVPPSVSTEEANREIAERLSQFEFLKENMYLTERYTNKETKRMTCDCFLTEEEFERGEMGCGEDCLNRLLMIECGSRCNINDRCTNKRFQNCEYAKCEVFRTEKKGLGLRASADIQAGEFIMEYVGEVLDPRDFRKRAKEYSKDKHKHYYFMALKSDQIIDATARGNISRFINHSCDPNAETQKWTVNGELRIGFFNRRFIAAGEEITFDYHFQRYGKEAQKCYCEAPNCRGWIGDTPEEEKEKTEKKEKRERDVKKKREVKKSYMEDEDLEEEIDKLCIGGLKNRAHTLTLSRLMVRSREMDHRTRLLKVIQSGEQACRRLFLDYHGLRLIWSYMMDVASLETDEAQLFKLELLKTLSTLPIPNKTMLMDSKVFGVVEKWSKETCSSPKADSPEDDTAKPKAIIEEIDSNCDSSDKLVEVAKPKNSPSEKDSEMQDATTELTTIESENVRMILELAANLLADWSNLKEVFRIPKKERIEQMKEHEREADIGYREDSEKEERRETSYERHRSDRYSRRDELVRERSERRRGRESPDSESYRSKEKRSDERSNLVPVPKLSKYERRQLFALKVAKEEEERIRRQQQEMFQVHESKCLALGLDPLATPILDSQTGYPLFFNPNISQWQSFPIQEGSEIPVHNPMYIGPSPGPMPSVANQNPHQSAPSHPPIQSGMTPDVSPGIPPPVYGINQPSGFPPPGVAYSGVPPPQPQYIDGPLQVPNNLLPVHNGTPPISIPGAPMYIDKPVEQVFSTATPMESVEEIPESQQPEIPPLDLPPKWKCAKDSRGRYYYYHVKERISQWLPPPPTHIGVQPDSSSSSESSEDTSSSEEDEDIEEVEEDKGADDGDPVALTESVEHSKLPARVDPRTSATNSAPETKKRRDGLVQERIISPRREEDRVDHKKYKEIKDKLRRQKERIKLKEQIEKMRKQRRANKAKSQARHTAIKLQAIAQSNELTAERKIKDSFRVNMATVIVKFLNPYRQNDCKQGRINNTEDFKYLARKLTHFVMAKELKHCKSVDELQCNENVKHKAKDFVRKYMNKFGAVYQRSSDDD